MKLPIDWTVPSWYNPNSKISKKEQYLKWKED